ncbi:TPA: hypothetical protein ACY4PR_004667 [Enterobacter cloacae]
MDWRDLAKTAVYTGDKQPDDSIWERVEGVDVEFIGAFLTAHLSLEKYITDYLSLRYPSLSWSDARLTFSQKIALIQNEPANPPYNEIYIRIKDFNNIRNKISHNLNYQLSDKDKEKFKDFYKKITHSNDLASHFDIESPADLICFFSLMASSYFASRISYYHSRKK